MAHDVEALVGPDGWIGWGALTDRVDRKTIASRVGTGRLERIQPGVYALPAPTGDRRVRLEAAVLTSRGLLSHRTALELWRLVPPSEGPIHLTVATSRSGRGTAGICVHRSRALGDCERRADGLPVTSVERSIVDAWGRPAGLTRADLRAAAIDAVRGRMCRPRDLLVEIERRPCLPGRAALVELVRLLAEGCQSELEIWGCLHVLRGRGPERARLPYSVCPRDPPTLRTTSSNPAIAASRSDMMRSSLSSSNCSRSRPGRASISRASSLSWAAVAGCSALRNWRALAEGVIRVANEGSAQKRAARLPVRLTRQPASTSSPISASAVRRVTLRRSMTMAELTTGCAFRSSMRSGSRDRPEAAPTMDSSRASS